MAKLNNIVRAEPLSRFRQVGPEAGAGFGLFAEAMETLYSRLAPAAQEEMRTAGQELGVTEGMKSAGELQIDYPDPVIQGKVNFDATLRNQAMAAHGGPTKAAAAAYNFQGKEAEYGLPAGYLSRTAQIESGGNPKAKNPRSSAGGLFQFIDSTARQYGLQDRFDPAQATDAAARLARDNAAILRRTLGRDPTAAELYLAHQQGAGGAAKLLANPGARASDIVGAAAVRLNGGDTNMTAQQFAQKWIGKFDAGFKQTMPGRPINITGSATATMPDRPTDLTAEEAIMPASDAGRAPPGATPAVSTQGAAPSVAAEGQTYTQPSPTVTFRNGEGKLEGKMYSPFSGPILQAHNIAAKSAYQATVLSKGQTDLMQISSAFKLDPEGFEREASAYIDQLVSSADAEFRSAIRMELTDEMTRRGIGIMDAYQSDVRQRAANSNQALVERYAEDYSQALAVGDVGAAEVLQAKLTDVLRMRESLPGLNWTMEQSANVIRDAQRAAETEQRRQASAYQKQTKEKFSLITKTAKAGRRAEGEEILNDPMAVAANPEAAREAQAFVTLRDQMPEFLKMTPAEMLAAVDRMSEVEVSEEWQLDVVDAARKMAVENRKAWDEDPVKRAGEVLEVPPPDITAAIETGDPERIVGAMSERRDYMNGIRDQGYTETYAFLSEQEADSMATMLNTGADPAVRAAIAGAVVEGFGEDAVRVFEEIDGDKLTMYAGKLMASGGRPALAEEILRGQTIMNEGIVEVPTDKTVREVFNSAYQPAFARVPGGLEAQAEVMQAARAIYSARVAGLSLDDEQKAALLDESINAAMGQRTDKRGRKTGGVQEIGGVPTLLPPGIAGEDVDRALAKALPGKMYATGGEGILNNLQNALSNTVASALDMQPEPNLDAFAAASMTGEPLFNGAPIDRETMLGADFGIVALGGDNYMLSITVGDQTYYAENQYGKHFVFGLEAFVEASR